MTSVLLFFASSSHFGILFSAVLNAMASQSNSWAAITLDNWNNEAQIPAVVSWWQGPKELLSSKAGATPDWLLPVPIEALPPILAHTADDIDPFPIFVMWTPVIFP
jgi:hypothetical protein